MAQLKPDKGAAAGPAPLRHIGVFNVLFCDGHYTTMSQSDLQDSLFYAQGP